MCRISANPTSDEKTTCIQDKDDDVYSNGHSCMGCLGGSPDMIAWDVVESLWDVLSEKEKSITNTRVSNAMVLCYEKIRGYFKMYRINACLININHNI